MLMGPLIDKDPDERYVRTICDSCGRELRIRADTVLEGVSNYCEKCVPPDEDE